MPHRPSSFVLTAGLLAATLAFPALPGCGRSHDDSAQAEAATLTAEFTVRGRVMQMPTEDNPASEFRVHHEPIPEWKRNYNQPPVGMNSMVMEFPPASPEVINGLAVGDPVSLTFRVEYDDEGMLVGWKTTRVEKLPPETELAFERDEAEGE